MLETEPIFLEIFITADAFQASGFEGRSAVEDEVDEDLEETGLGEVTGGGSGIYGVNIDIEVEDEDFEAALNLIRETLRRIEVPKSTVIRKRGADIVTYNVYE